MPKISIIVPVYKVEGYLHKCVDSILAQTFTDFELILVDDGSPDASGIICDEYAQKDARVRVIHKENGGVSDTRNTGLDAAQGEYIGFVDSDDWIDPDMYEKLYENLVKEDADMIVCGFYDVTEKSNTMQPHSATQWREVCSPEQAALHILQGTSVTLAPWSKLCKRSLFDNIRYPKGMIYEDAYVILDLLLLCERVVIDTTPYYYYLNRPNSIMTGDFSEAVFDVCHVYARNLEVIDDHFPTCHEIGMTRLCWAYRFVVSKLALCEDEAFTQYASQIKESVSYVRRHLPFILKSGGFTAFEKTHYMILSVGAKFYRFFYRRYVAQKQK